MLPLKRSSRRGHLGLPSGVAVFRSGRNSFSNKIPNYNNRQHKANQTVTSSWPCPGPGLAEPLADKKRKTIRSSRSSRARTWWLPTVANANVTIPDSDPVPSRFPWQILVPFFTFFRIFHSFTFRIGALFCSFLALHLIFPRFASFPLFCTRFAYAYNIIS